MPVMVGREMGKMVGRGVGREVGNEIGKPVGKGVDVHLVEAPGWRMHSGRA